jgi:hypothetical protein
LAFNASRVTRSRRISSASRIKAFAAPEQDLVVISDGGLVGASLQCHILQSLTNHAAIFPDRNDGQMS